MTRAIRVSAGSDLERQFITLLNWLTPKLPSPAQEFRFDAKRRWRFDFAWPAALVAVELEGGVYANGRHTRGKGFEADAEKYNVAVSLGWRVYRLTRGMLVRDGERWIRAIEAMVMTATPRKVA